MGGNLIHHIFLMGWFGSTFDLIYHLFDLPEYIHVKLDLQIKSVILIRPGQALRKTVSGILVCLRESLGLLPLIKLVDLLKAVDIVANSILIIVSIREPPCLGEL